MIDTDSRFPGVRFGVDVSIVCMDCGDTNEIEMPYDVFDNCNLDNNKEFGFYIKSLCDGCTARLKM